VNALRKIVVVGRDAELWLTALPLARALKAAGTEIQVIELPSQLSAHDCYSAAPSLSGLHALLGLDRRDVLRTCSGVPVVGQRFSGWSRMPFFCGYDAVKPAISDVDLLQYWTRAQIEGFGFPYERLSTAATAAAMGRVPVEDQDGRDFGAVHSGFHLLAKPYAGAMATLANAWGLSVKRSDSVQVNREGDRITSILIEGGYEVTADLFVDASGPDAVLSSRQPGGRWSSWSKWLPMDRLVISSAPPLNVSPPFADMRAVDGGWVGIFPLTGRSSIVGAFASELCDENAFVVQLTDALGTSQIARPIVRQFAAGMRRPWIGNCVAVGASAVSLPPLDLMQLHLTHVGVTNLIAWLPGDVSDQESVIGYNDVVGRYAENVRDFQAAHHLLNDRMGLPFWDAVRQAAPAANLQRRIALFEARGIVPVFDEETFDAGMWAALFTGHGLVPRSFDPRVQRFSHAEVATKIGRLLEVVENKVGLMRTIPEYLAR